jgi:hypothetical protein
MAVEILLSDIGSWRSGGNSLLWKYAPQQASMPVVPIFMNRGDQTYWSWGFKLT